jgi:DNA-binding MarR family transcriptional regulator
MNEPFVYQYLVRIADNIDSRIAELMRESGLEGLTRSHFEILSFLLRHKEMTLSHIASRIQREKATVTVLVRKLEKKELVQRRQNEADKRSSYISLTSGGRSLKKTILGTYLKLNQMAAEKLTKAERMQLHKLLVKLHGGPPDTRLPGR